VRDPIPEPDTPDPIQPLLIEPHGPVPAPSNVSESDENPGEGAHAYEFLDEIGRGAFGVVMKCRSKRTRRFYACKQIAVSQMTSAQQRSVVREVLLLRRLRHPNIIRYYTSFVDGKYLYIITELAVGGDLQSLMERLRKLKKRLLERQIWRFVVELSSAVQHMHSHNIVHRDIKSLNVFLSAEGHIKV